MGLIKKNNYTIEDLGIVLEQAYAQIRNVTIDIDGNASVIFVIQQDRESIATKQPIDVISWRCNVDKSLPIFEQIYIKAKEEIFNGWEDNIV